MSKSLIILQNLRDRRSVIPRNNGRHWGALWYVSDMYISKNIYFRVKLTNKPHTLPNSLGCGSIVQYNPVSSHGTLHGKLTMAISPLRMHLASAGRRSSLFAEGTPDTTRLRLGSHLPRLVEWEESWEREAEHWASTNSEQTCGPVSIDQTHSALETPAEELQRN